MNSFDIFNKKTPNNPKDLHEASTNCETQSKIFDYPSLILGINKEPSYFTTKKLKFVFEKTLLSNKTKITLMYNSNFLDVWLDEMWGLNTYAPSSIENMLADKQISIFEDQLDTMYSLINEFCVCYKNHCYLACCCLAREMIYEVAIWNNKMNRKPSGKSYDFMNTLNYLISEKVITGGDCAFWKKLITWAGDAVHYNNADREEIANFATRGIVKIFQYIDNENMKNKRPIL